MIKLIVSDVDGTLIDDKYSIPQVNMEALNECKKAGIKVILATGKLIYSLLPIIKPLKLAMPQITAEGATLIDSSLRVHKAFHLEGETYLKIIEFIKNNGCHPLVTLEDNIMYYDTHTKVVEYIKQTGEKLSQAVSLTTDNFKNHAISISLLYQDEQFGPVIEKEFMAAPVKINRPWKTFVTILPAQVSKGRALKSIIDGLGLNRQEVAVFGDNINDLSMFEQAGLKIAVSNAHQNLAESADIITGSNLEGGVGKAIYQYILKNQS